MSASDRYRLGKLLKQGPFSELYEAVQQAGDRGFERRVAIKRLRQGIGDENLMHSFIDESRVASQLSHPNIVTVFDCGSMDGRLFQAMELIDGLDLAELMGRAEPERVPVPVALFIAVEIAHALAYAHEARDASGRSLGLVHRDVTPQNILLSWDGAVKLADFGIAWSLGRLAVSQVGEARGKLGYMAPEQALASEVDPRTDVYALACVLHEMLVGKSPLQDERTRQSVLAGGDLPIDVGIDRELQAILTRATRQALTKRHASAVELADDLGQALAKRLSRDPRSQLKAWLAGLRPKSRTADPTLSQLLSGIAPISAEVRPRTAVLRRDGPADGTLTEATEDEPTPIRTHATELPTEAVMRPMGTGSSIGMPTGLAATSIRTEVGDLAREGTMEAPKDTSVALSPDPTRSSMVLPHGPTKVVKRTHLPFPLALVERPAVMLAATILLIGSGLAIGAVALRPPSLVPPSLVARSAGDDLQAEGPAPGVVVRPVTTTTRAIDEPAPTTTAPPSPALDPTPRSRAKKRSTAVEAPPSSRANVERAAARRGLSWADLGSTPGLAAVFDRWQSAQVGPHEVKASAERALLEAIRAHSVDEATVSGKAARLATRLRGRLAESPQQKARLLALEDEFLSVRVDLAAKPTAERLEQLNLRLLAIERELGLIEDDR